MSKYAQRSTEKALIIKKKEKVEIKRKDKNMLN
jgi:hypothetical protein